MLHLNFKTSFKKVASVLHLWLGLASGLVIFIMALTGAIYAFQPELSKATQSYLSVKAADKPFLPVSEFKRIAEQQMPGKKANRVIFKDKETSVLVQFFGKKPVRYQYGVYMNPYTGEVLKVKDLLHDDFFRVILTGHMYLWLPQEIGHLVTNYATLIFLLIIISGIIMWWPRNKARKKTSFKVKWNASPKRLNYDLHNVFGFYASWIILFAVLTGLVWSFEWAGNAEFWVASGGKSRPKLPQPKSVKMAVTDTIHPLDKIFNTVTAAYPTAQGFRFTLPQTDSAAVLVSAYPDKGTFYRMDNLYFNQYTAREISVSYYGKYADASAAEKGIRMNYDIHVGAIAGLPGRILMFFAALVVASLPITGFCIWWGKRKKKRVPNKKSLAPAKQVSPGVPVPA